MHGGNMSIMSVTHVAICCRGSVDMNVHTHRIWKEKNYS